MGVNLVVGFFRMRLAIAKENPLFWANWALVAITYAIVIAWPGPITPSGPSDFRIRVWGMVLQGLGALIVWYDLTDAARHFGRAGFIANTEAWLRRLVSKGGVVVTVSGAAAIGAYGKCRATARRAMPPDGSPLAARVDVLEHNLGKIDDDLAQACRELDQVEARLAARIKAESSQREASHQEIRQRLHDSMVGNYAQLVFGAAWAIVGIVISALAPEIAKTIAGQWSTVRAAM